MTANYDALRLNEHPGKFEGGYIIDEYVHNLTLMGADDECGDVQEGGHYSLVQGAITDVPEDEDMTADEREFLGSIAGAIVSEDDRGFVDVTYYHDADKLEKIWAVMVDRNSCDEGDDQ